MQAAGQFLKSRTGHTRFQAPCRDAISPLAFDAPIFAALHAFRHLLLSADWPDIEALDRALQPLSHAKTGTCLSLVDQARLYDGVHYEQRIAERGQLATRHGNWHDLFNALVWKLLPETKSALNAGQVADILALGTRQRTRRQCAYTQFDEAGAVVLLRDPALLELWDRHDWTGLFLRNAEAWQDGTIKIAVVGHALFEHALHPSMLLVSRTLVLIDERRAGACDIDATVAAALVEENWLTDPQQLRPLPVSGIPGWHRSRQDADFYALQPCFRPLRPGRAYPAALRVNGRSCPG